jgi:type IV secretion system protein VirB9
MKPSLVVPAAIAAAALLVAAAAPPHVAAGSHPARAGSVPASSEHNFDQRHGRHRSPSSEAIRVATANRAATLEPVAANYLNAVQVYPFSLGAIYHVYTTPGQVTDIALQPGETLGDVAAGDTVRWVIGDTTSGSGDTKCAHVLVKPFTAGLSTNIIITTDRRTYHLALTSTGHTAMAALSWTYPADQLIALRRATEQAVAAAPVADGLAVDSLHFNYSISGDHPDWRPLRAFDDDKQTFVEFPASIVNGDAPPLFIIGPTGEAELVNYRVRGRFYVVDRIFDAAELRLGTKKQQIVRIDRVAEGGSRKSKRS